MEKHLQVELLDRVPEQVQALIRSQAGPGAGVALFVVPTNLETTIPPHLFRVVLLRRLRQPISMSVRNCRCGRLLDASGHHRAACVRVGMLGRRGFAQESVAARICREAGGRVRTNMFLRDMDLPLEMQGDSKSSWTVCLCAVGRSWQSTPHWCVLCTRTGGPEEEQHSKMGWRLKLERGRSPRIRSWWAPNQHFSLIMYTWDALSETR